MKKNLFINLLILFTFFTFGEDSIQIKLPPGQVFVGMNIQLKVQNHDPALQYKWNLGDNTQEKNGVNITHSYKEPKSYQIKCYAQKINGGIIEGTKTLVVQDNRSIQIQGGPFIAGTEVNMTANNFVENNIQWDFGDNTPKQNGTKNIKHTYQNPGNYTVKAFDFGGNTTTSINTNVVIIPDNRNISFTPSSPFEGEEITFIANNFTNNNLKWDFGNSVVQNGSKSIKYSYQNNGNFTVKVFDASKPPSSGISKSINIKPDNRTINISVQSPIVNQMIKITALNFSSNNLKWDFGNGIKNGSKNIDHKYNLPGTYKIKVQDLSNPSQKTIEKNISIAPDKRSINVSIQSPFVGQEITFTAINFSSNNLKWNFGNIIKNGRNNIKHKFNQPGTHTIKVLDQSNKTQSIIETSITVNPDNRRIRININNPSVYQPINIIAENVTSNNIEWDFGDGKKINGGKNISHFYSRKGQFKIIAKEIGSGRPKLEKRISINRDNREIEIIPNHINVGDFATIKLKNSTVNQMDWIIGNIETKRNSPKEIRYQFIDPGNIEIICNINGQTSLKKRITINDSRQILIKAKNLFEKSEIEIETINFKGNRIKWDFGNGIIKIGGKRFTYKYNRAGSYKIKAYDFEGKSKIPVFYKINIIPDRRAISSEYKNSFVGTPVELKTKNFLGNSIKWDFGDGTIKTGPASIKHLYKSPGNYTIKAIDLGGRDIKKIIKKVIVKQDNRKLSLPQRIIAGVPTNLGIKDYIKGNFEWKFDNGSIKHGNSLKSIVFKNAGIIKVTLIDKSKNNPPLTKSIKVVPDKRSLITSAKEVLPKKKVVFTALNFLGKKIKWNFGDGTTKVTSSGKASHLYSKIGKYRVIATDFGGDGKKIFQKEIIVGDILPGFKIETLEFSFSNGKYYTIAQKNSGKLNYNLRIKASGSALLLGKFKLDDVTLGLFEIYIDGGSIGYLQNSQKPKLPLTDLGMHKLSIEFSNYKFKKQNPILRYFVTMGKTIILKTPKNNSLIKSNIKTKFVWTTPYKHLDYEYAYSVIPFQFLKDKNIVWKKPKKNNLVILDLKKYKKVKYSYLLIRAKDKSNNVKAVSKLYSFRIKE